ncbi:hypothetical protein [Amycolatopsis sp. GM8]|uniref:hypothetical protein n=1 Tax=Amycolatopsis sp. GM8 TaxID=2896530 RepID=UPI001F2EF060|nr:hypothetical protein [Amycolatopsis sp. GM8]
MDLVDFWAASLAREPLDRTAVSAIHAADRALAELAQAWDEFEEFADGDFRADEVPVGWAFRDEPGIGGIWGVGLTTGESRASLRPAVFVDRSSLEVPEYGLPLPESPYALRRIGELGLPERLTRPDFWVYGRDPVEPQHCHSSAVVDLPGQKATLGCRVTLANGRPGVTTAGHGVSIPSTIARVANQRIGRVADTICPRQVGPGRAVADIALVELDRRHVEGTGIPVAGYTTVTPLVDIVVQLSTGFQFSWPRSALTTLWENRRAGGWGNVVETDHPVTQHGDSGAPVYLGDPFPPGPPYAHLTAHVVAGDAVRTIIQDVDYQLRWFNAQLRP